MKRRRNHRRRHRVIAAAAAAGAVVVPAAADAAPIDANLLVNGDFETVDLASTGGYNGPQILNWSGLAAFAYSHDGSSSNLGVVPNYADGTPPAGAGHWYFTSNNAGTVNIGSPGQFYQDIDVSQGPTATLIESGAARYDLGAFMSSYLNDGDFGNVHVDFLDAGGGSLGSQMVSDSDPGPNNVWSESVLSGVVPVGTYTVRVSLFGTAVNGGQDGYIDNVDFRVVPEPSAIGIAGAGLAGVALARKRRRRDSP